MAATCQVFVPVPASAAKAAILRANSNDKALGKVSFKLENIGANSGVMKIQESADGVSYTDISGATATVVAGGEAVISVITHQRFLAIYGSGNTHLRADVTYEGRVLRGSVDVLVQSTTSNVDDITRTYDGL